MKNSWIKTELGEHIETLKGFAFKSKWYQKTGVAVVRVSDFTENSISTQALNYISDEIASSYSRYKIHHHDVIVQTVGSWQSNPASVVGKVIHVPYNMEGALLNQNAVKIIPKASMTQRFLYYLLKANNFRQHNLNYAQGAANQASITLETIRRCKLNLPPIGTQQKIASILSAYDDLIENNTKRIELLEEQAQLIYEEWFVRMKFPDYENTRIDAETGLHEGWRTIKLIECCNLTMGQSPKSEFYNSECKGLPFHQGVKDYGFRYPTNTTWSTKATRLAEEDSILFSVRAPVGRLNVALEQMVLGRGLSSISHKEGFNSFLLYQLQSIFFRDNLMGGGAIFDSVTKKEVEGIKLIKPTEDLVHKFDRLAKNIDKSIKLLTKQNKLLNEARDILLPRLMMGIIEV